MEKTKSLVGVDALYDFRFPLIVLKYYSHKIKLYSELCFIFLELKCYKCIYLWWIKYNNFKADAVLFGQFEGYPLSLRFFRKLKFKFL